jgi:hypothetical protein
MAPTPSSRPTRGVPLGFVVAGMVGLQLLVVAAAFALHLPIFRG